MSVEVVHDDHGGIWVITGTPTDGAIDERPPGGGPRHRINDRWTP